MPWPVQTRKIGPAQVRTLLRCLLVIILLTSCTRQPRPPLVPDPPLSPPPGPAPSVPAPLAPPSPIQYGLASWYGRERHGQRTASGEIYDSGQLTAAHRTAPFGTYVLVTNLENGQTVQVRINDRGPATAGRVLDLSYAAAHQLGMVRTGVTRVKVEFVRPLRPLPSL